MDWPTSDDWNVLMLTFTILTHSDPMRLLVAGLLFILALAAYSLGWAWRNRK